MRTLRDFWNKADGIYDFVNSQEDVACFVIKMILKI